MAASGISGMAPQLPSYSSDQDALYTELWHACAGPQFTAPRAGDLVFYFVQGHIEQVEASTNLVGGEQLPPPNLLCRVINVEHKVTDANDVYAQITLLPEPQQEDVVAEKKTSGSSSAMPRPAVRSFCKMLTESSIRSGAFSVERRHAEECLPPLDMNQSQELLAKDNPLITRILLLPDRYSTQPKRHFFTNGLRVFVKSNGLVAGDAFVFIRSEESGDLRVGFRRALGPWTPKVQSSVSSHNMALRILDTAWQAVKTHQEFDVYYNPRTSPSSKFIIPYDQYMESVKHNCTVGMRFSMKFESDVAYESFTGTIVGCENLDPQWPKSTWRCLKVRWDGPSIITRPDRVSPWVIKPASSPLPLPSPESYVLTNEGKLIYYMKITSVSRATGQGCLK